MRSSRKIFSVLLLVWLLPAVVLLGSAAADETEVLTPQAVLEEQMSLLWQGINAARQNPRDVLQRLEISYEEAVAALGENAWVLDQGLRPLAWNGPLYQSAYGHGRDMLSRLFYSHYSPEGLGPADRIAATGYQAVAEEEHLGALFFNRYVEIETAAEFMLETLLRDELTSAPGSARRIFSPDFTEAGIALFAETVPLLEGEPYVYLLVINYAHPVEPRGFIIGQVDPGLRVALRNFSDSLWELVTVSPGSVIQVPFPAGGTRIVTVDDQGDIVRSQDVFDFDPSLNRLVDLRTASDADAQP